MSAHEHLSPGQFFASTYGPGEHSVPLDHVWGIRDTEAVDHPSRDVDVSTGIRHPLEVWSLGGHASLGDGHHRLLAAKRAGHTHVPVVVNPED